MVERGRASRTALGAAGHRAAHQILEGGRIFADPLAVRILGPYATELIRKAETEPERRGMRIFIAIRTRFAEEALAAAIARGVTQLVVLGAGLDTYAYRAPAEQKLRVFEVDHPATQLWKRERLSEESIAIPSSLTFVPIDFETETLAHALAAAGFDATRPSFFTWLGVVPYLTEPAIDATLQYIASLPGGAHVVFDYGNPPSVGADGAEYAARHEALAARVAALGESLKSYFETDALQAKLRAFGFREIEDTGPLRMRERFFPEREGPATDRGGHVVRAAT
jgi:methyltransferase (TIGR00027 family)